MKQTEQIAEHFADLKHAWNELGLLWESQDDRDMDTGEVEQFRTELLKLTARVARANAAATLCLLTIKNQELNGPPLAGGMLRLGDGT